VKPIGSVTTGFQPPDEQPQSSTGQPHGATGSGAVQTTSASVPALAPISSEEELNRLSRLSTGLLRAWRDTEFGQPLNHNLTPSQLTASIALLKRAQAPADSPVQVLTVLKQMLIAYVPPGKDVPEDAVRAWLYVLEGQPLASIIECARIQIKSPDDWAPKPGQFLAKVRSHADGLKHMQRKLEETLPDAGYTYAEIRKETGASTWQISELHRILREEGGA